MLNNLELTWYGKDMETKVELFRLIERPEFFY